MKPTGNRAIAELQMLLFAIMHVLPASMMALDKASCAHKGKEARELLHSAACWGTLALNWYLGTCSRKYLSTYLGT